MGSHYRDRHARPAATTSRDLAGLGAAQPQPEPETIVNPDDTTLAQLKEQAEALGLPTYGTKSELAARINDAI